MNTNNKLARAVGFLYLVTIIAGRFAEAFVKEGLTVYGDEVATAQNILASEQMYRLGFVAENRFGNAIFFKLIRKQITGQHSLKRLFLN